MRTTRSRSPRLLVRALATALVAGTLTAGTVAATSTASAAASYTVTPLWFTVKAGSGSKTCDVVGDLYLPRTASTKKPVPAILATNGFGGSKADQAGIGKRFAARGYAVLSYSGLGFGGSGCPISLDDPAIDGRAASDLVSYLGGKTGIAFTDEARTKPAPALKVVRKDARDNAGKRSTHDPRVGMLGGSYGGQVQYAAASVDKRIDTIVPLITWHDLSYSLAPNNTAQTRSGEVSTTTPGAAKLVWALGFSGLGVADGLQNVPADPTRLVGCPNFASFVCPALVTAAALGTLDPTATRELRQRSVVSYAGKVTVPTLILQGQSDTLFNLNEGAATYRALRRAGTPVKMAWVNGGHSGPMAPGELELADPNPTTQYMARRIHDWFDHYLKGHRSKSTGPRFSYFRDWVRYTGNASPAYAKLDGFRTGTPTSYYLSQRGLTTKKASVKAGRQQLLTPVAGIPTSTDPVDVLGALLPLPEKDLPGTAATWTTSPLTKRVDVVGSPRLDLTVSAPTARATQALDTGKLTLFVKVQDVAPDGRATLIRNLVAPVKVPDVGKPFRVTLPAFVHRFREGHSIRLVVAGGSTNYRGGTVPVPVDIATGTATQVLTLPQLP